MHTNRMRLLRRPKALELLTMKVVPTAIILVPLGLLPCALITAGVTSEPWITYHVTWKFLKERYYLYLSIILFLSVIILFINIISIFI